MQGTLSKLWTEDDGILSFEWTLLVVLLVIGIVGGLAAARDVVIDELGDTAAALLSYDQSYSFAGIDGLIAPSIYTDTLGTVEDCDRTFNEMPYFPVDDGVNGEF
jgi:Flp pilus assembly pilin Flp